MCQLAIALQDQGAWVFCDSLTHRYMTVGYVGSNDFRDTLGPRVISRDLPPSFGGIAQRS